MCQYCFSNDSKGATEFTRRKNREFAASLKLDPEFCMNSEYQLAASHCIYPADRLIIRDENGREVWNLEKYGFLHEAAVPDSVHPSLWLNGKSNVEAGVFEVVRGSIYQVRGYDISNLSIIRSKTGWIVQDVMTTAETSRAALELLEKALGEPVTDRIRAIIISHSHGDHFGGVRGVVREEQVGPAEEGLIPIYVPAGFDIECVKENIFAGTAMHRRSVYQFGGALEPGRRGLVATGLGLALPHGTATYLSPTYYVKEDGPQVIDGITVEFQLTPGTEAPAEMNNYFADYRALWVAENCCGTLHNLYPIRGAQLRDAAGWANYILEAEQRFADRSDVVFQSHNWPHFNTEEQPDAVREFLLGSAAAYKYTHDQTLMYANKGWTAKEIAAKMDVPEGLKFNWYARPYYGTPQINARAVFTKYLGFYNGLPSDLNPFTEKEDAAFFVEYAGGEETVLQKALQDFENGAYRKAANAGERIVLVNPENEKARQLTADAYEQLAYTAESGIWRNAYLQGALELRNWPREEMKSVYNRKSELEVCMSADLLLAYAGILLDYDRLQEENFSFALTVTDGNGTRDDHTPILYEVRVYAGILLPVRKESSHLENYVKMPRKALLAWYGRNLDSVRELVDTNIYEKLLYLQESFADLHK